MVSNTKKMHSLILGGRCCGDTMIEWAARAEGSYHNSGHAGVSPR